MNIHKIILNKAACIFRDSSGITLFEVLVGIAVSSLIFVMIYSAHSSITKSIYQVTGIADFYENVNLVLKRIDKDISNAYINKENKNICLIGKSNYESPFKGKLNFVTVNHKELSMLSDPQKSFPESDINEVGYFLIPDKKMPELSLLIRREERHYDDDPESGGDSDIFLENVIDLKFEYRKGNDWTNNWDSRENKAFPKVIRTILKVRNYNKDEEEFIVISKINIDK
ncbi:MAG: type II secretion system protein GspJ [Spirochaetota bacterium]